MLRKALNCTAVSLSNLLAITTLYRWGALSYDLLPNPPNKKGLLMGPFFILVAGAFNH